MHITNPDYTELGFIKANYQQFIDLPDINFNSTSFYIEETVQIDEARNNVSFFGNTEGNTSVEAWSNANSRGTYRYKGTSSYDFAAPNEVHIYGFERDSDGHNKVYYDNTIGQPEVIRDFVTAINTTDLHCRLFNNGTANSYFSGFIFHVYIEYQGSALYDLYPAKRNADEVTGLYDVLTDTFFASGSGVDFIAGPDKASINITATTIGTGSVSIPATTECYEFITIDATPGTDYVFGGYFNDNSELVTLSRSLTFFSGNTDISFTVKFSDASTPVDYLTRTFSIYHSTGNTRTKQSDDVYIGTTVINFPRVIKSFSDKTGAIYTTVENYATGYQVQNVVDDLVFNGYIADPTKLTTLLDSDSIRNFFAAGDVLITNAPSTKSFNLRLIDEISGYYFTICLINDSDWGQGFFYDNEDNLIFNYRAVYARDRSSPTPTFNTFGIQGFEDGDVTENSKLVTIQVSKTTAQKNALIVSDQDGNVVGNDNLLNWFIGTKRGEIVEPTDPYDNMGNSSQNGGNGSFEFVFDFTPITELPERISAVSSGFVSLFQIPDTATMNSIAEFMNSPNWIQNLSKFFSEPADAIVSLHILPVELSGTEVTRADVEGGGVPFTDSGGTKIQADKVNNQYYIKDLGFINVPEIWGSDLDYQPYTSAELYLPYISFVDIDVDEIMGKTLGLVYAIDLLSGDCMAFLSVDGDLKYQFAGNCASKIPYNSNSHNIITEAGAIVGGLATMIAGAVAGNPGIIAAGGGSAIGGLMSVVKKNYRHGSGVGGTHGFLSLQKPVLYLKRPNQNKPANYNKYKGHPSNITAYLGSLSGFTQVDSIHLENISATDEERSEITMLLKEGVLI